jgi:hypothetical protein
MIYRSFNQPAVGLIIRFIEDRIHDIDVNVW